MSDRSSTQIRIGGVLPADQLPAFLDVLEREGVGPDWEPASREVLDAVVREASGEGYCLEVSDHDVAGGQFERLEAWLRDHDLAYYRYDDGYTGVWSATGAFWRPGMAEPAEWVVDDGGRPHLCYSDILTKDSEDIQRLAAVMKAADEFEFEFQIERGSIPEAQGRPVRTEHGDGPPTALR
ncbi:MAG TPA: hypothetical protein VKS60_03185 [Stellaceae bacterium]|nr:hypothetical protein [Stellaceae bacterium]